MHVFLGRAVVSEHPDPLGEGLVGRVNLVPRGGDGRFRAAGVAIAAAVRGDAVVALAATLHFGRAAEKIHITQPALSRQIKALENALGFAVVQRNNQGVELTAAGEVFLKGCKEAISVLENAFTDAELNSVYFNICVLSNAGTHPLIVREVLGGRVSVETLAIFMALSGCDSNWDHTDPSIANSVPRLKAYEGLLNYDPKRCLAIMRRVWHPTKNQ